MSLFIRCHWMTRADERLEARIAEASSLLGHSALTAIGGSRWYRLGWSKAQALARPVALDELAQTGKWRRVPLTPDLALYAVDLWNGCDYPNGVNLSIAIHVPPTKLDTFVLSANVLRLSGVSWSTILECAELLAQRLGGMAIVASHELLDHVERISGGTREAAYAAFWGMDRSGQNPHYAGLLKKGRELPASMIACDSWEDVQHPQDSRLKAIIETLADSERA